MWVLACKYPTVMEAFRHSFPHSLKLKPAKEEPIQKEISRLTQEWTKYENKVTSLVKQLDQQQEKARKTKEELIQAKMEANAIHKKLREAQAKADLVDKKSEGTMPSLELRSDLLDGLRDNQPIVEMWESFQSQQATFQAQQAAIQAQQAALAKMHAQILEAVSVHKPSPAQATSKPGEAASSGTQTTQAAQAGAQTAASEVKEARAETVPTMQVDGGSLHPAGDEAQTGASEASGRRVLVSPAALAEQAEEARKKAIEDMVHTEVVAREQQDADQQPASGRLVQDSQGAG